MKLKLIYFNMPVWRAEIIRIALFMNDIPFEDKRITNDEWVFCKENGELPDGTYVPFRQFPVLEVDGEIIAQAASIGRFCGKLTNLYPKNDDLFAARIDQILDAATDINLLMRPSFREKDNAKILELRKNLSNIEIPEWYGYLEKLILKNSYKWIAGDKFSIADIAIWRLAGWLKSGLIDNVNTKIIEDFPSLNNLCFEVANIEKIKKWVDKTYPDHYKKYLSDSVIKWQ